VDYDLITTESQLRELCAGLSGCAWIALDTEFVSEGSYRPELCLIQVSTPRRLAIIDSIEAGDMRPFWQAVVDDDQETIVHAGRSEMEFCLAAVGRLPNQLFDVQLAAGLAGIEYPAGYSTLVYKLLGESMQKHETRTDWRQRPLSKRQLDYAAEDAYYLSLVRDRIHARLTELGRLGWLAEERQSWCEALCHDMSDERWRRVSGNSGLDARSLAIVHELWKWREEEARRRNQPARRVLRDDLIVELAKRQTADVKRIRAVRGMERGDLARRLDQIASCIHGALARPAEECPPRHLRQAAPQLSVLGQFLFAALGSVCREAHLAPNLVGGPNDIRDWIGWRLSGEESRDSRHVPKLAAGWRAEFVGRLFDDLLAGKTAVRIGNPAAEHPLILERRAE
jgi:ribonuclease D